MKTITKEITTQEIIGYEADDGTRFLDEEQCRKYERSAKYACKKSFEAVAGTPSNGSDYLDLFCLGFDDEVYAINVRDANVCQIVNHYASLMPDTNNLIKPDYIGKKVAISIWDHAGLSILGTRAEMEIKFKSYLDKLFGSETEGKNEN